MLIRGSKNVTNFFHHSLDFFLVRNTYSMVGWHLSGLFDKNKIDKTIELSKSKNQDTYMPQFFAFFFPKLCFDIRHIVSELCAKYIDHMLVLKLHCYWIYVRMVVIIQLVVDRQEFKIWTIMQYRVFLPHLWHVSDEETWATTCFSLSINEKYFLMYF